MASCCAALLGWVLTGWPADEHQLAVALEATALGDRFTVLAICVRYRACAIPIAWTVLPAWHVARRSGPPPHPPRRWSVVRRGRVRILARQLVDQAMTVSRFQPEPWPPSSSGPPAAQGTGYSENLPL